MKKTDWMMKWGSLCLAALIAAAARTANAQGGFGRGPTLPPEKLEAAWAIEAKSVGADLKLKDDQTAKLAEAYKAARQSFQKAAEKIAQDSQGDRMGMMQGIMEMQPKEAEKFQAAIKGFLDEAQTKGAMASLGAFNRTWDTLVDTLGGFKLEAEKQASALKQIKVFIEAASKLQADAMANMDIQTLREEMPKLKEKLDEDMKPILTADQLAEWKTKTTRQRPQGGRGGRGENGPGGGAPKPPASEAPKSEK